MLKLLKMDEIDTTMAKRMWCISISSSLWSIFEWQLFFKGWALTLATIALLLPFFLILVVKPYVYRITK